MAGITAIDALRKVGITLVNPARDLLESGWTSAIDSEISCASCRGSIFVVGDQKNRIRRWIAVCDVCQTDQTSHLTTTERSIVQKLVAEWRKPAGAKKLGRAPKSMQQTPRRSLEEIAGSVTPHVSSSPDGTAASPYADVRPELLALIEAMGSALRELAARQNTDAMPRSSELASTTGLIRQHERETPPVVVDELELRLSSGLAGHRLIFEVDQTAETVDQLQSRVRRLMPLHDGPDAGSKFPATIAVYLANQAVTAYRGGAFWPNISIPGYDQWFREAWSAALPRLPIDQVNDIETVLTWKYVTPIVIHAGIPDSCMGDFFTLVSDGIRGGGRSGRDLLARWRSNRWAFNGIDLPVQRFLLRTGELAADFVDRCLDLFLDGGSVSGRGSEFGLPERVCVEFDRWRSTPDRVSSKWTSSNRVGRPTVVFDPWSGLGPAAVLPRTNVEGEWVVSAGDETARVRSSSTSAQEVPVKRARTWRFNFADQYGSPIFEQSLPALEGSGALLVDASSFAILRDVANISADGVIVVSPSNLKIDGLSAQGETALRVVEEYPPLVGDWTGFAARHFDLRAISTLRIHADGQVTEVRVRPESPKLRLEGELVRGIEVRDTPIVFRATPSVNVPVGIEEKSLTARVAAGNTLLATWDRTEPLNDWLVSAIDAAGIAEPLTLLVRGPLGADLRVTFCVVPGLAIKVPVRTILPTDVRRSVFVRLDDPAEPARPFTPSNQGIEFIAEDGAASVSGVLPLTGGAEVRFEVDLPVFRWAFASPKSMPLLNADRTDLNLEDLVDATLLVTCGAGEHNISVSLFEGDHELHRGEPKSTNAEGRLALRLDRFADSAARAKGAIRVVGFVNGRQVALARIRRFVTAKIAKVVTSEDGQTVEVTLLQSAQLNGRALLVTQLARPWVAPRRFPIADGIDVVTIPAPEIFGRWRIDFVADDGWNEERLGEPFLYTAGALQENRAIGEELAAVDSAEAIVEQAIRGAGLRRAKPEQAEDVSRYASIALFDVAANITGPFPQVFRNCAALAVSDRANLLSEANRLVRRYRLSQTARLTLSVEFARVLHYAKREGDPDLEQLESLADKLPLLSMALAASTNLPFETLGMLAGIADVGVSQAELLAPSQFLQHAQMFLNRSHTDRMRLIDAMRLVPGPLCSRDEQLATTLALLNLPADDDEMMRFGLFTKELRIGELTHYPAFAQELIQGYLPSEGLQRISKAAWYPYLAAEAAVGVILGGQTPFGTTTFDFLAERAGRALEALCCRVVLLRAHTTMYPTEPTPLKRKTNMQRSGYQRLDSEAWSDAVAHLGVGLVMDTEVTSVVNFGVFALVGEKLDGLVHILELGIEGAPQDGFAVGDPITVEVISVDHETQRVALRRIRS